MPVEVEVLAGMLQESIKEESNKNWASVKEN